MPPLNWRFRCPEGHTSWQSRPTNESGRRIHCENCEQFWSQVLDMKTGKLINQEDIRA